MLKDLDLHEKVTGGQERKSCWAVEGKTWFTSRHHRETPRRIETGEADVGIVWVTEVDHAQAEGRPIDGVSIRHRIIWSTRWARSSPPAMIDRIRY